ncbi:hypothetical protein C8R46DRAFT_1270327, partial [Mycena filopes]
FVDDEDFRPTDRLAIVQQLETSNPNDEPFRALDELYTRILCDVSTQPNLLRILCVIVNFALAPRQIGQLLGLRDGDVSLALRRLHSVLMIPPEDDAEYALCCREHPVTPIVIYAHHASFVDFLMDPARSGRFCVDGGEHRMALAHSILKTLAYPPYQP